MIKSSLKRERRMRRKTHRRLATKERVTKDHGEQSGVRKHYPTSANPRTKSNNSTKLPKRIKVPNGLRLGLSKP